MPNLVNFPPNDTLVKQFGNIVAVVGAGTSRVVDARGMNQLTVITGAASSATVSRVDVDTAGADSGDTAANVSVSTAARLSVTVDWGFYRVTASGGSVRVACV